MSKRNAWTAAEIEKEIESYRNECISNNTDMIWSDLLLRLGISRDTWNAYRDKEYASDKDTDETKIERENLSRVIKKAEAYLSQTIERGITQGDPRRMSGYIYLSKQKAYGGYSDAPQVNVSGSIKIEMSGCGDGAAE